MANTSVIVIPEGKICDYIDGKFRNDTPEEYVRQTIEKRLVNEHKYLPKQIRVEYTLQLGSRKPRADIVIFDKDCSEQTQENIKIIIECKKEAVEARNANDVFSDKYNAQMLVAAVAKVNGYFYAPDPDVFWKQGYSQDNSFIYVTTQYLTATMLDSLAKEVDAFESLLICAPAFDVGLNKRYDNITVKKIPQSVLDKCEYGVDNYNLNIVEVPECDEEEWEDD